MCERMKQLTQSQVLDFLRKRQGNRSSKELAEELGISASYLSEVFSGKREPGPSVIAKLGLERKILYLWKS
jgi:transcriptional regulator with XRE-family HTH domain